MREMAKDEMMNDSNEYCFDDHASSAAFEQNVSGTDGKIDTPLTQPCSRSRRNRSHDRHQPRQPHMLELTEKLEKGADGEQRRQIMASLKTALCSVDDV
jgi:hypothetical protein